jgi:outer membrane receptor protein involved in Fe transport
MASPIPDDAPVTRAARSSAGAGRTTRTDVTRPADDGYGNDAGAPNVAASAGITLGEKTGWFGALRWRYLGPSPLTEDGAFRSPPTSIFNGRIGYRFDNGWRIQLGALNLLNTKTNQINYAYGSLLPTDPRPCSRRARARRLRHPPCARPA